ncbi:hypothetical protein F4604DRAFT_355028 [Suillus subluteus]|nr:hypothetical protein F4604DRAFT_355028 [Suillus subluteus]
MDARSKTLRPTLMRPSALALRPPGHSDRYTSLKKLSDSLHDIFKQRGTLSDLDGALKLHRAVLALAPPGHPDQFDFLHHLANSLIGKSIIIVFEQPCQQSSSYI